MRIVTIVSGMLLVGTGIWCFAHPGAPFITIAFLLGVAMLISGLSNILAYIIYRKRITYVSWQLAEGLLTAIFATIVLSNAIITDGMIILFFGMWIQFSGVLRMIASIDIRKEAVAGWHWPLITGAISLLAGIYCFLNPLLAGLALVVMIGGIFILQGANCVVSGLLLRREARKQMPGVEREPQEDQE